MSFLDNLAAFLPFGKKEQALEYFFALSIGTEKLTVALWTIENKKLKILETASQKYNSNDEIITVADKLLDQVLGVREIEPQKILFGVPNSWLTDDNLKEEYLKLLRNLVKKLELTPMAYVAGSHALIHFLEKEEDVPTTAILIGFEEHHLVVTVVRAGKLDGVKVIARGENSGVDLEKALLTFTDVETLPSKIWIYGLDPPELDRLKFQLLSFPWMSKLSFLHFPKIDILGEDIDIKSICLAGGSEIDSNVTLPKQLIKQSKVKFIGEEPPADLGFVVGDVSEPRGKEKEPDSIETKAIEEDEAIVENEMVPVEQDKQSLPTGRQIEIEDFESEEREVTPPVPMEGKSSQDLSLKGFVPRSFTKLTVLLGIVATIVLLIGAYFFLAKAEVKIFVEPKVLEKDAQVVSDPNQKAVNEEAKIIPGQIVDTEVSGSGKEAATGKKQVGDAAKGTVVLRNKTDGVISLSKSTILTSSNGLKFSLDLTVNIASRSAEDGTWGKATATITASLVGADGNLPSGTDLTVSGQSTDKIIAKSEGNFSGGTSKDITVVSDADQKRLLASLASDLRRQAQQKLQEKLPGKKILEEALEEFIVKKSYSKAINDQAAEFSLDLTIHYKGTAFEDKDLKQIVGKLVTTEVPPGFKLNLEGTETQADVSKLEKDGKLIFLARFKAKLLPEIDTEKVKNQIRFKTSSEVADLLKSMDNVLGSDIRISPILPKPLQRFPLLGRNIKIEVGLK